MIGINKIQQNKFANMKLFFAHILFGLLMTMHVQAIEVSAQNTSRNVENNRTELLIDNLRIRLEQQEARLAELESCAEENTFWNGTECAEPKSLALKYTGGNTVPREGIEVAIFAGLVDYNDTGNDGHYNVIIEKTDVDDRYNLTIAHSAQAVSSATISIGDAAKCYRGVRTDTKYFICLQVTSSSIQLTHGYRVRPSATIGWGYE